jgi:hypothetical protein
MAKDKFHKFNMKKREKLEEDLFCEKTDKDMEQKIRTKRRYEYPTEDEGTKRTFGYLITSTGLRSRSVPSVDLFTKTEKIQIDANETIVEISMKGNIDKMNVLETISDWNGKNEERIHSQSGNNDLKTDLNLETAHNDDICTETDAMMSWERSADANFLQKTITMKPIKKRLKTTVQMPLKNVYTLLRLLSKKKRKYLKNPKEEILLSHSGGEAAQQLLGSDMDSERDPVFFKIPPLLHLKWLGSLLPVVDEDHLYFVLTEELNLVPNPEDSQIQASSNLLLFLKRGIPEQQVMAQNA